jgi:ABC-type transport system involved in multi-copper enzyme maturation permease subunit
MTAATLRPTRSLPRLSGLTWVTWRQHRIALIGAVALPGLFAILLLINGTAMHADYHRLGLDSCDSKLTGAGCQSAFEVFTHRYQSIAEFLPHFILFIPALLGAFVGAPLIARELESGTFRFAWTQGTNRAAWTRAKLIRLGTILVVLALAFTALFTWWFHPFIPLLGRMRSGAAYEIEGTVFAARTLFGFALGAFLGAVIRRTVPAMAATLALWVGAVLPSVIYLRKLIQTPLTARDSNQVTSRDWTLSQWFQDRAGHHLSDGAIDALLNPQIKTVPPGGRPPPPATLDQVLAEHGVSSWVRYQPASRFWHFQIVETSAYVLLALLLASATVWWVRRRAT